MWEEIYDLQKQWQSSKNQNINFLITALKFKDKYQALIMFLSSDCCISRLQQP